MTIHVDVETNGLSNTKNSLLSVYAEKENGDTYERFYFPVEEYNKHAIKVNGLTEDRVEELRGEAQYPNHFKDDHDDLISFLAGCSEFAAFNASFDFKWMPEAFRDTDPTITCTMSMCKHDVQSKNIKGHLKNPNLKEALFHFWDELEPIVGFDSASDEEEMEKIAEEILHDASFDTKISKGIYLIYKEM